MNTTIQNSEIKLTVSSLGAELMSLIHNDREYLWQGEADVWEDRSPVLFPICGRLKDARYSFKGNVYEMGIHGFLWKSEMTLLEKGDNYVTYLLKDSEESMKIYPFKFEARVTYKLDKNRIAFTFDLCNTGDEELYFSHGYHPGFILPMCEEDDFSDCLVEFSEPCEPKLIEMSNTTYLVTGELSDFPLENGRILRLTHELFDTRSVFLKDTAKELTLRGRNTDRSVTVSFPDCEVLGFWQAARKNANYLCVEPWNGLPSVDGVDEELSTKKAGRTLKAGESYSNTIYITLR